MHALQCPQCYPRDKLPQVWIQEPPDKEQREEGLMIQAL
jgi:hypothetical protein